MKLLGILVLLFVCLVFTVKAQQSTSKSTTSKTNAASTVKPKTTSSKTTTKINPTTPKTKSTTTSKITAKMNVTTTSKKMTTTKKTVATTTLKPKATTTVKKNVTTTTLSPVNIPKFFVCRDTNSSAATGILLPYRNTSSDKAKNCKFSIVAPPNQQIQISCSTMNIIDYSSYFYIGGSVEYGRYEVVVNRDYYSINNSLSVTTSFDYPDWFECKWTALPQDNTTNFKLCRHAEAKTANGTIQPLGGYSGLDRICSIIIVAPSDYQIEISCSSVSFNINLGIEGVLDGSYNFGKDQNYNDRDIDVTVSGRKYYSINNRMTVFTSFKYPMKGFNCSYTAIPKEITTESKFCRHAEATVANGTISPIAGDTRYIKQCAFRINAAPYQQQIRIVCSVITPGSYLEIFGINDKASSGPTVNRTYYSVPGRDVTFNSYFGKNDRISCQWTTTTRENTTSLQICRDNLIGSNQTANGTLEPLANMNMGEQRSCSATISAPDGYQIQLSCSAVNMSSDTSYLRIDRILDLDPYPLELNKVYFSDLSNEVTIFSAYEQSDWFYCKWKIALRETKSPNSQFCRDAISTAANGTVTSIAENTSRQCPFVIKAPPGWILRVSCSNLSPDGSSQLMLKITGIIDYSRYEDFVFENRMYTATLDNQINLRSLLGDGDWIQCKWTTTLKNTTDFKICSDGVATSSSGTIQPSTTDDAGPIRSCPFTIQTTSSDQQIQMSCSVVHLTSSVLNIYGVVDESSELVQNRIYTSLSYSNEISLVSEIEYDDWIDCKWNITTVKNTTDYKFCRDSAARTANGTIQPLTGDPGGPLRECYFSIKASLNEQIRISCSTLKLTSPGSYLRIFGIIGTAYPAILNRVYYSDSYFINEIYLHSGTNKGDWIDCKWTTIPEEITPNSKLCRHQRATTPNGTITPLGMTLGEPKRECEFTFLKAKFDQQIQFSCSTLRLSSGSYLNLYGVIGLPESYSVTAVILNRVYYSTRKNDLRLSSKIGSSDTFNCTWTTIPLEKTSQFKLCRHAEVAADNGTITPIEGDTGQRRNCSFHIKAYPNQKIELVCSVLKLASAGSYLRIKGLLESANPIVLNQVYTSTVSNDIILSSLFDKSDALNCSWKITPRY